MPSVQLLNRKNASLAQAHARVQNRMFRHVLVCIDGSPGSEYLWAHAAAMAAASGAQVSVLRVLEAPGQQAPTDPVEWALRHQDAETDLREQAAGRFPDIAADVVVVDGPVAGSICSFAQEQGVDLTVIGVGGEGDWPFFGLGSTARRVAETVPGSVLLVPPSATASGPVRYHRLLMPLDGSHRAECVLPLGVGIASCQGTELVILHAAPDVDLSETEPLDADVLRLRDGLRQHNERAAEKYLNRLRSRLPRTPSPRMLVIPSGDPRQSIARAAAEQHADLLVLSATGKNGQADMALGSVADYLINHMSIPVLLVRSDDGKRPVAFARSAKGAGVRMPSRALM